MNHSVIYRYFDQEIARQ